MNARYGITLLSLVITIVILLLLAGVTISTFNNGNILGNTESAAEQSKISAKKTEIELAIIKVITKSNGEVSIEDIIEELEKEGIINKGDGNPGNGQVKVQPDGYIFEITEDEKGNWEVEYIGKGDIERAEITISVTPNTTLLTDKVIVTITANADSGIKKFTGSEGSNKTYTTGTKEIEETCEITKNGTYTFTVENNNGKTVSKEITINNILEGIIQISPDKTMPTKDNVKVTITWPVGSNRGVKEIKVGNNSWQTASGDTSIVEITQNCTIIARIRNTEGEVTSSSLGITNIDKTKPTVITVAEGTETIKQGTSYDITGYFTYVANGTAEITSVTYTDTSDANKAVTNTNTLAVGTHVIKCTVTKETGLSASATKTIIVEQAGLPSIDTGTGTNEITTEYQDKNGNKVVVPGGFKVRTDLATTVEEGIVIEDVEGNQFVWIPVGTITKSDGSQITIDLGRYTFDATTGTPTMWQSAENYEQEVAIETNFKELATFRESDGSRTNTTAYNLQKWINSALVNGGYYIARYEASFGSGEASGTITNQKPQFKQSTSNAATMTYTQGTLWNNITQADASKVCRNMYPGNLYVESDLINSYAWDTAIDFIQKCSNNSNYANKTDGNGTIKNTGETGDVLCNIYDMAANLGEWTTENTTYYYVGDCGGTTYYPNTYRGSTYGLNTNSTSKRNYSTGSTATGGIGFRGILTIATEIPKMILSTTKWTAEDVIVKVEWPQYVKNLSKQIKIGNGEWKEYTGEEAVSENCTVTVRAMDKNGKIQGLTVSVTITNIDKTQPIVTVKEGIETIYFGNSIEIDKYFSIEQNGPSPITINYIDESNGDKVVTNTNTLTIGTHIIKCIVTKETGIKVEKMKTIIVESAGLIPIEDYGQYVTNYTTPSGDPNVKWRIYYADDSNIYLISDDYIHFNYAPRSANEKLSYAVGKEYEMSPTRVKDDYKGSENITDPRITKWLNYVNDFPTATGNGIQSVAFILDEPRWSEKYVNKNYADYAIGAPTLEMFCASYRKTHPTRYIEYTYDEVGYDVKWSNSTSSPSLLIGDVDDYNELYIVTDNSYNQLKSRGMWIASPASNGALIGANSVHQILYYANGGYKGFRPIVCLKSGIQLEKQSDGTYIIK